jgi:hypothetical protein
MVPSFLIITISFVLLVYWFRYSCLLVLRNNSEQPTPPALNSQFTFRDVQKRLRTESHLDPLHHSLNRDYQVLTYLLDHASGLELANFEDRLLFWDYKAMQWWYRLTKTAAPGQARRALREMACVLGILVGRMGTRAGLQTHA